MKYLVICVAGMQDIVAEQLLKEKCGIEKIVIKEEGLVVYESSSNPDHILNLKYINNAFMVLDEVRGKSNDAIEVSLNNFAKKKSWHHLAYKGITRTEKTFRIVISSNNQLVSANKGSINKLGDVIKYVTRLRWESRGIGAEFWVLKRASGIVFFAKRITRRAKTERNLQKGELRPELAHLLCLLSEPKATDVFMDPFAGSGAIPLSRTYYPYNMIFCSDIEGDKVRSIKDKIKEKKQIQHRKKSPIITRMADAKNLEKINDGFIDKVVCDPPWGIYDKNIDISTFYLQILNEIYRITKPSGIIVVLLGSKSTAIELINQFNTKLFPEKFIDILVSGKKAVAIKFRKNIEKEEFSS